MMERDKRHGIATQVLAMKLPDGFRITKHLLIVSANRSHMGCFLPMNALFNDLHRSIFDIQ
jgi:hypothetical protein